MLNFAEQTGSGAVIVVWSFLSGWGPSSYITSCTWHIPSKSAPSTALLTFIQSNNLTSYACKTHTTAHLVSPMDDFCHHCLINPPKNGQLFTAITQVSLNLHQFILFYMHDKQSSHRRVKKQYKSSKISFFHEKKGGHSMRLTMMLNQKILSKTANYSLL